MPQGADGFFLKEKMNELEGPDLAGITFPGEVPSHKNPIARLKQKAD
jgi:hypothetical protein